MANQESYPARAQFAPEARTDTATETRVGLVERWRQRHAEHQRRVIVQWLRRTANHTGHARPRSRTQEPLLRYRIAAVRADMLEIAAALERAHDPDPSSIADLHRLLASGCDSPLYNPDIHPSELLATLHALRTGFADKTGPAAAGPQPR
jgi:hypothetical protein